MTFTDWRQLAAMQFADLTFRGIVPWDKTECARAPHTGYFRHQAEFVVWGSNGKLAKSTHGGPWPGVVRCRVRAAEKLHVTGKPVEVMEQLVQAVPPNGVVFDPFAGAAATAIACVKTGRKFVGVEYSPDYFDIACHRVENAMNETRSNPENAGKTFSINGRSISLESLLIEARDRNSVSVSAAAAPVFPEITGKTPLSASIKR